MTTIKTVFLDRDGVINQDSPKYIKSWKEFHFIPGSRQAIARFTKAGMSVILITNQSMINRGLVPLEELETMHRKLRRSVSEIGGRITDIFFCPHHPDEQCQCRKPKPGMFFAARERYDIDLSCSVMVGDNAKDIWAGQHAGCGKTVLVKTGNGIHAIGALKKTGQLPDYVTDNLDRAADWILTRRQ